MAQISLPRLEKINTTMFWESGVFIQNERWLSAKLYIVHKLLGWYILNKNFLYFNCRWHKNQYFKFNFYKVKRKKNIKNIDRKFLILGRYIFQFRSKNTTLILYTREKKIHLGLQLLYKKIQKQYCNKTTLKYYNKFMGNKNVTN